MTQLKTTKPKVVIPSNSGELDVNYLSMFQGVLNLIQEARRTSVRTINSIMTATYWEIGRRIVEYEMDGQERAEYGKSIIRKLSQDLTSRFGKGFGYVNLNQMRKFYRTWSYQKIIQKASEQLQESMESDLIIQEVSEQLTLRELSGLFKLPWSHYVRLLSVKNPNAREFYETEALRGGWSEPQLDRQISSMFYESTSRRNQKD